jgi:hypothetical protein
VASRAKVKKAYKSAYPNPLRLRPGDKVAVERRECEWPGWFWCTDGSGKSGWIPEAFVDTCGEDGTVLADYDATEHSVVPGDVVEIMSREGGWVWCRTSDGKPGWLPEDVLDDTLEDVPESD